MKKLLALLLLLTFLPCAHALELPYPADTVISVMNLTETQQALCDLLYEPIFYGREEIDLPDNTLYDDAWAALCSLMQDYPELFHLGKEFTFRYYQDEPDYVTSIRPVYIMSAEEAAELRSQLYVQSGLLVTADASPEALYDQLCTLVFYGGSTELCHTAVGALLEGQATCEGYAKALTLLYRMAGIPCGMVTGTAVDSSGSAGRHAWNIAYLLGDYCLLDATWDDQDNLGMITHWYYGLDDASMAVNHTPDADQVLPRCGGAANWHRRRNRIALSQATVDEALQQLVSQGEAVNLRIPDRELYVALSQNTSDYLTGYNSRFPDSAFYGSYSITCSDALQCVIIRRTE